MREDTQETIKKILSFIICLNGLTYKEIDNSAQEEIKQLYDGYKNALPIGGARTLQTCISDFLKQAEDLKNSFESIEKNFKKKDKENPDIKAAAAALDQIWKDKKIESELLRIKTNILQKIKTSLTPQLRGLYTKILEKQAQNYMQEESEKIVSGDKIIVVLEKAFLNIENEQCLDIDEIQEIINNDNQFLGPIDQTQKDQLITLQEKLSLFSGLCKLFSGLCKEDSKKLSLVGGAEPNDPVSEPQDSWEQLSDQIKILTQGGATQKIEIHNIIKTLQDQISSLIQNNETELQDEQKRRDDCIGDLLEIKKRAACRKNFLDDVTCSRPDLISEKQQGVQDQLRDYISLIPKRQHDIQVLTELQKKISDITSELDQNNRYAYDHDRFVGELKELGTQLLIFENQKNFDWPAAGQLQEIKILYSEYVNTLKSLEATQKLRETINDIILEATYKTTSSICAQFLKENNVALAKYDFLFDERKNKVINFFIIKIIQPIWTSFCKALLWFGMCSSVQKKEFDTCVKNLPRYIKEELSEQNLEKIVTDEVKQKCVHMSLLTQGERVVIPETYQPKLEQYIKSQILEKAKQANAGAYFPPFFRNNPYSEGILANSAPQCGSS